jgi:hypothetical protein
MFLCHFGTSPCLFSNVSNFDATSGIAAYQTFAQISVATHLGRGRGYRWMARKFGVTGDWNARVGGFDLAGHTTQPTNRHGILYRIFHV